MITCSVNSQIKGFQEYNEYLKGHSEYYRYAFSEGELFSKANLSDFQYLFFCHCGNILLTIKLALKYFLDRGQYEVCLVDGENEDDFIGKLILNDDSVRPFNSFYILEAKGPLGKDFQGVSVIKSRKILADRKSRGIISEYYGASLEAFQLLISSLPQIEAMDGDNYPYLLLPGLKFNDKVPHIAYIATNPLDRKIIAGKFNPETPDRKYAPLFLYPPIID